MLSGREVYGLHELSGVHIDPERALARKEDRLSYAAGLLKDGRRVAGLVALALPDHRAVGLLDGHDRRAGRTGVDEDPIVQHER